MPEVARKCGEGNREPESACLLAPKNQRLEHLASQCRSLFALANLWKFGTLKSIDGLPWAVAYRSPSLT
jgi:hypothetical protein